MGGKKKKRKKLRFLAIVKSARGTVKTRSVKKHRREGAGRGRGKLEGPESQ